MESAGGNPVSIVDLYLNEFVGQFLALIGIWRPFKIVESDC